jgi:hypothetical protein
MKLLINSYIKRDHDGYFISGQVLYESIVTNQEAQDIPDSLTVNLSKSGHNSQCDTLLKCLQLHNGHAGTFTSRTLMREYIRRVTADVVDVVDTYNMALEEIQSKAIQLAHAIVEHNEDLAPLPAAMVAVPPGAIMFDPQALQDMHDLLFGSITLDELSEEELEGLYEEDEE